MSDYSLAGLSTNKHVTHVVVECSSGIRGFDSRKCRHTAITWDLVCAKFPPDNIHCISRTDNSQPLTVTKKNTGGI